MSDLDEFFESYATAWAQNSPQAIESHWDQQDPAPFYKAEEIAEFFTDWEALKAYWAHNEGFHDAVRLQFSNLKTKALGEDLVLVTMHMRWDIAFAAGTTTMDGLAFQYAGRKMGGDNHILSILRRVGSDWKLCVWSETPDAPITYIAQLYHGNVSPGFPDG